MNQDEFELNRVFYSLLGIKALSFSALSSGSNNRSFKVDTENSRSFLLKHYFFSDKDRRNRINTEFSAFFWLKKKGVLNIPTAIAVDSIKRVAIYEYIEGCDAKGFPNEVKSFVEQSIEFTAILKRLSRESIVSFPHASEAVFSKKQALESLLARFSRFDNFRAEDDVDHELISYLRDFLAPEIDKLKLSLEKSADFESILDPSKRILSPSDFGFHNAIRKKSGELCFIDFEYFGSDDPVKLCADFLLHPGMSLNNKTRSFCYKAFVDLFSDDKTFKDRFSALFPVFCLKWCFILLNEFLKTEKERRDFSKMASVKLEKKIEQLEKSKLMLKNLSELDECFN